MFTIDLKTYLKLLLLITLSGFWLILFKNTPGVAIISWDVILCIYLASMFDSKYSLIFILHPVIVTFSSLFFSLPFLHAGDGMAYSAVLKQYIHPQNLEFVGKKLFSDLGILGFFQYTSLGIVPVLALPRFIFENIPDEVYYIWQNTFHVALCVIVAIIAKAWNVFDSKKLLVMVLFAVISPSFFELNCTPTRHVVTFFGVFLLFVTHFALIQNLTVNRILWYAIALVIILISKWVLIGLYMVFVLFDLFFINKTTFKKSHFLLSLILLVIGLKGYSQFSETSVYYYQGMAKTGVATFSYLTQIPLLGWLVKYVYAILAPFPWLNASTFLKTNYSGNVIFFIMHILSALTGLYLFFVVVIKWREILNADPLFKGIIAFAIIMSLSIIGGSTGFTTYLLIYFPMLAILFTEKKFRINLFLPISFAIILELFMFFVQLI